MIWRKCIFPNNLAFFSRAPLEFRDLPAPLVRREREEPVESPVVLEPVDPLESVYATSSFCQIVASEQDLSRRTNF